MSTPFAFVLPETGEVHFVTNIGLDEGYVSGQQYNDYIVYEIDRGEFSTFATSYYYDNGWQEKPVKPDEYYKWTLAGWVFDDVRFWAQVRALRDDKLSASDWTQIADAPLTELLKTEWQTYRQDLRDVPADNSAATSLDDIIWPDVPAA
jgi:hypothetical protein